MTKPPLVIRHLDGLTAYQDSFTSMQRLTAARDEASPDEVWLLEHEAVLTQGQAGKPEHILFNPQNLPIIQSDRGGQVTWHGPGQLVGYLLYDLPRLGWHVRHLVTNTEQALITLLNIYDIDAHARQDAPGVYVGAAKIGSLGFKIKQGRSYHGLSLNLNCDLAGFAQINPCGYSGLAMTRLIDELRKQPSPRPMPTLREAAEQLANILKNQHNTPVK